MTQNFIVPQPQSGSFIFYGGYGNSVSGYAGNSDVYHPPSTCRVLTAATMNRHYTDDVDVVISQPKQLNSTDMTALAEQLFAKMFEQSVVVVCTHCESCNAISNATCVRCGAPLGKATARKL